MGSGLLIFLELLPRELPLVESMVNISRGWRRSIANIVFSPSPFLQTRIRVSIIACDLVGMLNFTLE